MTFTLTVTELDHSRDDRECPACAGQGFLGRDADQDGDYGLPCRVCHTTGQARYCTSCALAGAPPEQQYEAAYELAVGTHSRRCCVRFECVGEAMTELRALVRESRRPGPAYTRTQAEPAKEHAS